MAQKKQYPTDHVEKSERLSRIVLYPQDIDPTTNYPKDTLPHRTSNEDPRLCKYIRTYLRYAAVIYITKWAFIVAMLLTWY